MRGRSLTASRGTALSTLAAFLSVCLPIFSCLSCCSLLCSLRIRFHDEIHAESWIIVKAFNMSRKVINQNTRPKLGC